MRDRPRGYWLEAILEALEHFGGEATLKEIREYYLEYRSPTEHELSPWQDGLQPNYECTINRTCTTLTRQGRIERVEKGRYRLL